MGIINEDEGKFVHIEPQDSNRSKVTQGNQGTSNTQDFRLVLTATESFSRTDDATVTSYPVSSGSSSGDHYRYNGATINFKGVLAPSYLTILNILSNQQQVTISSYLEKVREVMTMLVKESNGVSTPTSPRVNIYLPDGNAVNNCVITSFKITRDVKVSNGYYVEVSAKELLMADTQFSVKPKNDTFIETKDTGDGTGTEQKDSNIADRDRVYLSETLQNLIPGI